MRYFSDVCGQPAVWMWICGYGDLDIHCAIAAVNPFALIPIAIIPVVRTLRFQKIKVFIHLSSHHFFDRSAKRSFNAS